MWALGGVAQVSQRERLDQRANVGIEVVMGVDWAMRASF